jgi:uncharacterized protein YbjT (DUF2867 family)
VSSTLVAPRTVAVAGAGGFIGRALVPELVGSGHTVRRLARHPETLPRISGITDQRFDLDDSTPDASALAGVDAAFYLVHSMESGKGFAERDAVYAHRFAAAARAAHVSKVVYLGGLYPRGEPLSAHLGSRRMVGEILRRECGALHVRAGIIVGRGSASFDIMRDLVRRLPIMITPRWVDNRCQAAALSDVVIALARAIEVDGDREVDLAGRDVLTYREMLQRTARAMGLRRRIIVGVPVLTPRLSARWLRFITSVSLPIAHALVESLRHEALADGPDLFTEVGVTPCSFDEAMRRALSPRPRLLRAQSTTQWDGDRCTLVQRFRLTRPVPCDRQVLSDIDAEMRRLTQRAALHLMRWKRGDDLRLMGWSMLRLGEPTWDSGVLQRTIDGGWLVRARGGTVSFACRPDTSGMMIEARLSAYAPRLPRPLYALQARLHRSLIRAAVRRALATGEART